MKKFILGMMIVSSTLANAANSGIDPQYLKIKIYKFAVSTSEYCTNPQVILSNANPVYEDLLSSPMFGTGSISNGTYKCVMIEMSDNIKFASNENSDAGGCIAGQENTLDLCRGGESTKTIAGQTVGCQVGEDRVTLYLSVATVPSEDGYSSWFPPIVSELRYGIQLNGALIINGSSSGTFVIDGRGKVSDITGNGGTCELDAPVFSFR